MYTNSVIRLPTTGHKVHTAPNIQQYILDYWLSLICQLTLNELEPFSRRIIVRFPVFIKLPDFHEPLLDGRHGTEPPLTRVHVPVHDNSLQFSNEAMVACSDGAGRHEGVTKSNGFSFGGHQNYFLSHLNAAFKP